MKMKKQKKTSGHPDFTRRDFLKGSSFATLMTLLGGVQLVAQPNSEKPAEAKPPGPKVKCAVIGLGPWGREIAGTLLRLPQAELAAICDTYPASLKRAANTAPNTKTTEDYKTILDDKEIAAVVIATPSHLHREVTLAALQAGKHVYCEAPLATTLDDARAIAQAAKAAVKQVFQPGLQMRSDPHLHFLLPFIRSGAMGKTVMARAQWHKKQSWRFTSPNPDRETALNWRVNQATSPGLIGEIGIHQLDQVAWFLNAQPVAVNGFGTIAHWKDDRDVADTVQAVVSFPGGARLTYDCTLANSFDGQHEVYFGTDAAILLRENKAWMFKEADSPLLGWEVYARKDVFYKETGIALVANASKLTAQGENPAEADPFPQTPLYYALEAFLGNCAETAAAVEDYSATFDPNDKAALGKYLSTITKRPAATCKDGLEATVMALKANEAIVKGEKVAFQKEWFELA